MAYEIVDVDGATQAPGSAAPARAVQVAGSDGTNTRTVKTAADGTVRVDPSGTTAQPVTDNAGSLTVDTGQLPATLGQKTSANSLPVVIASDQSAVPISAASLPLPVGAAQEHVTAGSFHAARLTDGTVFYKGTTPADTQPISAASLPLPTGAATESTLATRATESTLATRAADATLTGGTQKAIVRGGAKGATAAADVTSNPVDANTQALHVDGSKVTQPVSGTITANIGTSGSLALDATLTGGTQRTKVTDGTNNAAVKAASTAAVAADPALVVAISPNNTVPVSAASLPLPTGAATETTLAAAKVDLDSINTHQTDGTQKAIIRGGAKGTTVAGDLTSNPIDANTQALHVDGSKVTQPISGSVTANIGTSGALALDATLTTGNAKSIVRGGAKGATTAADATSTAEGADHQALDVQVMHGGVAKDPTAIRALTSADVVTAAQGTAAAAAAAWPVKVTDGTNTLPTMDAVARAGFQKITDGTQVAEVTAASTAAAASDPALVVAVSPNSIAPVKATDLVATGSVTANGQTVTLNVGQGQGTVGIQVSGTYAATLQFEGSIDGTNFFNLLAFPINGGIYVTSIVNAVGIWTVACAGFAQVRIRCSAFTSGTAVCTLQASFASSNARVNQGNQTSDQFAWPIRISDGTNAPASVKAASTAPVATDKALVVVLSPNQAAIPTTTTPGTSTPNIGFGDITLSAASTVAIRRTAYTEQSANFTGSVSSSSAADASAGTGARQVTIFYVDVTGATAGSEVVTLNGTTAVNLVTTTKCYIEKIIVSSVGTGGANAGTISLFTGAAGAGTLVGTIAVGDNRTFWAHHYVVTGKTCNVTDITHSNNSSVSGGTSIGFLKSKTLNSATAPENQISDIISVAGATNEVTRNYGSVIQVAGPSRVTMFTTVVSGSTIAYRGSFSSYDA